MARTSTTRVFLLLGLAGLGLAGCGDLDPYRRDGMWQPEGVAYGNLAAQVVNPRDLIEGRGQEGGSGGRAAQAIMNYTKQGPGGAPALGNSQGGSSGGGGSGGGSSGGSGGMGSGGIGGVGGGT